MLQQVVLRPNLTRPYITVVLAMSADGKITDSQRSAARFPSAADKAHLERQVAKADATLVGAGTLRAYGTTLLVTDSELIAARQEQQQAEQPIQIICSATGNLDPRWRFFQQPIPRWLLTTPTGEAVWFACKYNTEGVMSNGDSQAEGGAERTFFDHRLVADAPFNWSIIMQELRVPTTARSPVNNLVVMGGGELVASLLAESFVDELYLTVCPLLIGGKNAPTPVEGLGFTLPETPQLKLQSARTEGNEVFLHYSLDRSVVDATQ